jgi:hypothetical protein
VVIQCISQDTIQEALAGFNSIEQRTVKTPLEQVIDILDTGMKYTFKDSWATIFELITIVLQVFMVTLLFSYC